MLFINDFDIPFIQVKDKFPKLKKKKVVRDEDEDDEEKPESDPED